MKRLRIAVLCFIACLWTTTALAQSVLLLRPPSSSLGTAEVLARLQGELLSVGIGVTVVPHPPDSAWSAEDPQVTVRELLRTSQVQAIIEVLGELDTTTIHLWMVDPARAGALSRVALSSDEHAPSELAIRAIEVLRSRLLETDLASRGVPSSKVSRPQTGLSQRAASENQATRAPNSNRHSRFGFELGAAALVSFDRLGPAVLPLLRINWSGNAPFVIQATTAGFGTRPTITNSVGSARVAQQLATCGARTRWPLHGWFQPFVAVSGGVLRTAVEGFAEPGREGHSLSQWSFLFDVGAGTLFELGEHYSLTVAAHLQLAEPNVVVHFVDEAVASSGRPNLLMSLALGAWP